MPSAMYTNRGRPQAADLIEVRALEKMAAALCRHVELLWREAGAAGKPASREAELHRQAFEERRNEAMRLTRAGPSEPSSTRIAKLERLVEALEVSRAYFKTLSGDER
jgi:hypothetical protein